MTTRRLTLAQLLFLSITLVACGRSHGAEDTGTDARMDSGIDARVDAGSDSGVDGGFDAGSDAGVVTCDAEDVRVVNCPDLVCDGPPRWHWNGDSCFSIECGACEGADCAGGFGSADGCIAAHADCAATVCRETEGEWMWWVEECGHRECGQIGPEDCLIGSAVCNCGPERSFDPELGCVPDDCPVIDPLPRDVLCRTTGGTWGDFCCDSVCGELCGDDCVAPACDCPPLQIFDAAFGCVESAQCYERRLGDTCAPGRARCETGTICCEHCGGAGCFGAHCQVPLCDEDETIDECGNNLLAP